MSGIVFCRTLPSSGVQWADDLQVCTNGCVSCKVVEVETTPNLSIDSLLHSFKVVGEWKDLNLNSSYIPSLAVE
jgi:hypothetical protein